MSPLPLTHLTLRLSSPSFLETVLTDVGHPFYSTETDDNSTYLSRCDPVRGLVPVANIRWPEHAPCKPKSKEPPAPQVMMDGWLKSEADFLRRNCLNTSRKFYVPGHSHSLKWKRVQDVFQCVTSCGTPVAVFVPAHLTAHARLNLFAPSLSGLPTAQGTGVSTILVDYLVVTALLLVTHPEDWRGFRRATTPVDLPDMAQSSRLVTPCSTPVSPITSSISEPSYHFGHARSTYSESAYHAGHAQSTYSESESYRAANALPALVEQVKEEVLEYEPPPPYEEIQWTVRVRQPRRPRT